MYNTTSSWLVLTHDSMIEATYCFFSRQQNKYFVRDTNNNDYIFQTKDLVQVIRPFSEYTKLSNRDYRTKDEKLIAKFRAILSQ